MKKLLLFGAAALGLLALTRKNEDEAKTAAETGNDSGDDKSWLTEAQKATQGRGEATVLVFPSFDGSIGLSTDIKNPVAQIGFRVKLINPLSKTAVINNLRLALQLSGNKNGPYADVADITIPAGKSSTIQVDINATGWGQIYAIANAKSVVLSTTYNYNGQKQQISNDIALQADFKKYIDSWKLSIGLKGLGNSLLM